MQLALSAGRGHLLADGGAVPFVRHLANHRSGSCCVRELKGSRLEW